MRSVLVLLVCGSLLVVPAGLVNDWVTILGQQLSASLRLNTLSGGDKARQQLVDRLERDNRITAATLAYWQRAARLSLQAPLSPPLPHVEQWSIGAQEPGAVTYALNLTAGRVLALEAVADSTALGGLVIDVLGPDHGRQIPLASWGPGAIEVRWVVPYEGVFRVRVQAMPGTQGRFGVAVDQRYLFDFPVDTPAQNPVRSLFGVARDGGRRQHHGIDIFAPRGTPVLAAVDGEIARVDTSNRGGLHIWQRGVDDNGEPLGGLYYAHLDTVEVLAGTPVKRGDRIGGVGNTGNARTTPPHLHFGWYQRFKGPQDPFPLTGPRQQPRVSANAAGHQWPEWRAVAARRLNVRAGPGTDSAVITRLEQDALLRVEALSGEWLRVQTAQSGQGFVLASLLGPAPRIAREMAQAGLIRSGFASDAPVIGQLEAGEQIFLRGRFGDAQRVETQQGLTAWLTPSSSETPARIGDSGNTLE